MSWLDVLLFLVFLLPPVDWTVFVILTAARRHGRITALTERRVASAVTAAGASIAAYLAWVRFSGNRLPQDVAIALLAGIVLCLSLPNIYFLWLFVRGDFGRDGQ